jgi:hypothetical protein
MSKQFIYHLHVLLFPLFCKMEFIIFYFKPESNNGEDLLFITICVDSRSIRWYSKYVPHKSYIKRRVNDMQNVWIWMINFDMWKGLYVWGRRIIALIIITRLRNYDSTNSLTTGWIIPSNNNAVKHMLE